MRIAMVAGEASGDLLAAHLIRALRVKLPDVEFVGIGGPRMEAEGFKSWWPAERLAVNGFVDVLRRYRELYGIRQGLIKRLKADPPDLFVGVDAPDFNLGLERRLKDAGIPTAHFVSPSIWAWRGGRINAIGRAVDHVLCLFPCEAPMYARKNIPATYVGHPLADAFPLSPDRAAAREQLKIDPNQRVLAMLPGSRVGEVSRLVDSFIETAKILQKRDPEMLFLVPLVTRATRDIFEHAISRHEAHELSMRLLFGHSHAAMVASDVVLVASGTATLEAALLKRPMVIAYRASRLTAFIVRRLFYLPYAGLPNILSGRFVVPEFMQEAVVPEAMADALEHWFKDKDAAAEVIEVFTDIHRTLRQNTAERAAEALLPLIARSAR